MTTAASRDNGHRKSAAAKDVVVVAIVVLVVFLLIGLVVAKRSPNGEAKWLSLSPDTEMYTQMVVGAKASPPFAYRRLVPFIASLVPFSPVQALGAITLGSLLAGYGILAWFLVSQLQVRRVAACLAVVSVMTSTRGLLIIQNPYIIDGFSFLVMTIMLSAFLNGSSRTFGVAAVIGVLAREDCLFGVFGFVAGAGRRRARASIVVALLAAVAYVLPRLGHGKPALGFLGLRQIVHASYYAKAYFAFGVLWPVAFAGLWVARASKWNRLVPYSACALAGSMVSTFFAVDTTRMFLPMLPIVAVGCALVFDRLLDRPALVAAWASILVSNVALRGAQFVRQWRLLKVLEAARREMAVEELRAALDEPHSKRTLYRDLRVLQHAGFPLDNEKQKWRLLESGEGAWTVPVGPTEVVALMLSEDLLAPVEGTWLAESLGRLRARLAAMLTPTGRAYCLDLKRTQVATLFGTGRYKSKRPQIDSIHEAIEKEQVLRIRYAAPGKTAEKRTVEPYCTWFAAGRMYLVGYCRKAEDIRTFSVQRIEDAVVLDETFEPDPSFDAAAFTRKGFGVFHGPTFRVTIDFSSRVAHLIKERRYHVTQQVTPRGKGVRLKMEAAGLPELAAWVAGFGGDARAVAPPELVAAVEKLHQDALAVSKTRRDVTLAVTPD